jgi:hypothetical protein
MHVYIYKVPRFPERHNVSKYNCVLVTKVSDKTRCDPRMNCQRTEVLGVRPIAILKSALRSHYTTAIFVHFSRWLIDGTTAPKTEYDTTEKIIHLKAASKTPHLNAASTPTF